MRSELVRQLRGDEGEREQVYQDHLGYWTIGVGRLVDSRVVGSGLRASEIEFMLSNDIEDRIENLKKRLPFFNSLDAARQGALLNMSFQLGVEGLLAFKTTLGLVEKGNYEEAAKQMLKSRWATQTPQRAKRMSEQMRTGEWQYTKGT